MMKWVISVGMMMKFLMKQIIKNGMMLKLMIVFEMNVGMMINLQIIQIIDVLLIMNFKMNCIINIEVIDILDEGMNYIWDVINSGGIYNFWDGGDVVDDFGYCIWNDSKFDDNVIDEYWDENESN